MEVAGYSPEGSNTTPSFVALTSGSWPGVQAASEGPTPIYDSGTVSLLVNGTQVATTSYGSASTPTSIASALVSNGANNGLVTLSASGAHITITGIGDGSITDYSYQVTSSSSESSIFTPPSFSGSPGSGSLAGATNAPLYNWAISSYAPNGDVLAMTDYVMGTWSYAYDDFNRLTSGSASGTPDNGLTLSWTYDRYGNRWAQNATGSGNASATQPQLSFGNTNQVSGWSYDDAGNLLNDGRNGYQYDAEGRIIKLNGALTYVYDAEGKRVAKYSSGTISASYLLGLGGEQVTEFNNTGAWVHSNVWAGGKLLATYEGTAGPHPNTWHFHLTDWLGTERMQTTASGNNEEVCYSYPFGDGLTCTGSDATEHHFTGKERDVESGLDSFGARYLNSGLARWNSPDKPFADQHGANPQSWNLYTYVQNNPAKNLDMDGQSTITFDGQMHTITLYSANGTRVATFPAFNNVCYHAPEGNNPRAPTNGPMTDGVHSIKGGDQSGAISHLGDHGAYGPNGIIHVQDYWGVSGDSKVNGAGLHGGRSGPDSCTAGCLRTTNAAMAFINLYVYIEDDPLTEIDVQRNEATILSWAENAPKDVADHINWPIVNNDAGHDSSLLSNPAELQQDFEGGTSGVPGGYFWGDYSWSAGGYENGTYEVIIYNPSDQQSQQ